MGMGFFAVRTSHPHGRARERVARVGLVLGSCLATLGAIEAWLFLSRPAGNTPPAVASLIDRQSRVALDCYPSDPRSYFDVDLRDGDVRNHYRSERLVRVDRVSAFAPHAVELRYNSLQYRDSEVPPKRHGTRRVIVVGDSFTEGQGVKEDDTYVRVLEALLNQAEPGGWEVRNWGERGADFPVLSTLFDETLQYQPDVVVYGMVLNDADRSPEFQARQTYVNDWILDRGRVLEGGASPELGPFASRLVAMVGDRVESYRTSRATLRWYREMYAEPNRAGWERTQQYLREMNERTRAGGGRFLVATWPLLVALDRYPFADVHERIARFCLAAGIPQHDLLPVLRAHPTEGLWVHPVDMHPNEIAHRLAAESLVGPVLALP